MNAKEFHEYLIRLAIEAYHLYMSGDAESHEAALRERMAQAAQIYAVRDA